MSRLEDTATDWTHNSRDRSQLTFDLRWWMLKKLDQHNGKAHWKHPDVTDDYLLGRLWEECSELVNAIRSETATSDDVWREAADVANIAAMLADRRTM